ncbi:hypothetical protein [Prosthecobacter sp.]|uniref:hypothetical protein n=1 Tax=Prosthecobacter sp. TaxID=1965333 RepID=UPI003784DDA1
MVLPPVAVFLGLSNGGKISQGFAVALGLSAVLLHLLSCSQLAPKGCMFHVLFFGGYALLLLVLFFGCAMNAPY